MLLADDNPLIRRAMRIHLEERGYRVLETSSASDVASIAESQPVDLILLDTVMSGSTGPETIHRLKSLPALREIPIVVCSGNAARESVLAALRAGATDYIAKPFTRDTLIERVRRALERTDRSS